MTKGIIYVNSSHEHLKYIHEAEESAKSFKRFLPDAEYILYTDAMDFQSRVFHDVRPANFRLPPNLIDTDHKNGQMVAKHETLSTLSYDRTMYLGSDTYALEPEAASLFSLLDSFDLVAAHAPFRINTSSGNTPIPEIPPCFPEFNCDIVLFRKSDQVKSFLESWRDMYLDHAFSHPHDQGAFRYLAYFADLRIATLPPEYNYRGPEHRDDTVILQNRDLLNTYLSSRDGTLPKLAHTLKKKLCSFCS